MTEDVAGEEVNGVWMDQTTDPTDASTIDQFSVFVNSTLDQIVFAFKGSDNWPDLKSDFANNGASAYNGHRANDVAKLAGRGQWRVAGLQFPGCQNLGKARVCGAFEGSHCGSSGSQRAARITKKNPRLLH